MTTKAKGGPSRSLNANLDFWLSRLKRAKAKNFLAENSGNLERAVQLGLGDTSTAAKTISLLIHLHPVVQRAGQAGQWIQYYEIAAQGTKAKNIKQNCNLLNQWGALHWQLEQNARALIAFRRARRMASAHKLPRQEASARLGICVAHWAARDFKKAWKEAKKTVRGFRAKLKGDVLLIRLVAIKGVAAYGVGNYSIAESCFREALKRISPRDQASAIQLKINITLTLEGRGYLASALRYLDKTIESLSSKREPPPDLGRIKLLQALLYYRHGNLQLPKQIIERALSGRIKENESQTAIMESILGRISASEGKRAKAVDFLESASKLWEQSGNPWMVLDTLKVLDDIGVD